MVSESVKRECGRQAQLVLDVADFIDDMAEERDLLDAAAFFGGITPALTGLSDRQFLMTDPQGALATMKIVNARILGKGATPPELDRKVDELVSRQFERASPAMNDRQVRKLLDDTSVLVRDLALDTAIDCACGSRR